MPGRAAGWEEGKRGGGGSGGHALGTGGATRKARGRRSSHHQPGRVTGVDTAASGSYQPGPIPHPAHRLAPGPVTSPGWPSPTDSEVKRNVPSSMNASWKPLSCPFMVVVVVSESGVEKKRERQDCEVREQKTAVYLAQAGGAEQTRRRAARPSIYTRGPRAPEPSPAPRRPAPMRHSRGDAGRRKGRCAERSSGRTTVPGRGRERG